MRQEFLTLLNDIDLDSLKVLEQGSNKNIKEGSFQSSSSTKKINISSYIPRFVNDEAYTKSFGYEWSIFNKTQLDSNTKTSISKDRWESITNYKVDEIGSKKILEVGCGSGRFLEVLAPYAKQLVGLDMSCAVDVARENLIDRFPDVHFLQADINNAPLKENSFDLIYSIGVLHHTPSVTRALKSIIKLLKPGGELIVWVYGPRFPLRILPHDIIRYICCRLDNEKVLKFTRFYVPLALKTHSLPGKLGKLFRYFLMWAPNYPHIPIPDEMRLEWSVLDAYDTFATKIEKNYHEDEVIKKFHKAGFLNVKSNNTPVAISGLKPE